MPTNLPPEYFAADKRFKEAASPQEKIAALEELITTIPKHKGTDRLRADLRRKLSQLRDDALKGKRSGKGDLYAVERQGAAQVCLVGFANSGKSSIVAALTNAHPVIADFPVSTIMPLSGMMPFEDIQFQLVDLPPVGNEATDGWVSGILRNTAVLMLVVDLSEDADVQMELLMGQLEEWRIMTMRDADAGEERTALIAANKLDLPHAAERLAALRQYYGGRYVAVGVSTKDKTGLEDLRRAVFESSGIIRVFSKEPGKAAERERPFTLPEGSTVLELAETIHKDFVENLKYACIWGSARFDGQRVQRDYVLRDGDIVEFHIR